MVGWKKKYTRGHNKYTRKGTYYISTQLKCHEKPVVTLKFFSLKVTRFYSTDEVEDFLEGIEAELWSLFRVTMDEEDEDDDNE